MSVRISVLALVLLNLAVFVQVTGFEYTHFDDDLYVTDNPHVKNGLTLAGLRYAFSTEPAPMSNPLTLVSHMLDVEFFGLSPRGHHLTNLFLHIANSLLLFGLLYRMTARNAPALMVAALFAVHPLHVETVAWIADRKDLLSTFFWLGTVWAYVEYTRANRTRWLIAATALYTLSLLAKPMAVTLPFVLLLLDWWPLNRVHDRRSVARLLAEKTPLFLLTAIACAGTWYLQHSGGATASLNQFSIGERIANAFAAYGSYIRQTVWPFGLGIYYPASAGGPGIARALFGAAALTVLTATALLTRKSMPWIAVGFLWFVGMLVPVIGLVQVGNQLHADRYTYLPLVGLFIAAAFTAEKLLGSNLSATRRHIAYAAASAIIAALGLRAYDQASLWQNSESLFTHTLDHAGESLVIRNNLGNYYLDHGWLDKAREQYLLAEDLVPGHPLHTFNLAHIARVYSDFPEAIRLLRPLLVKYPDDFSVRLLLAECLLRTDDAQAAAVHAAAAHSLKSDNSQAVLLLGLSHERLGRSDDARAILSKAAEDHPNVANAQVTLANFLARSGDIDEAMPYYQRAIVLAPRDSTIHYNVGAAFERAGAVEQAIRAYQRALELNPMFEEAQRRLDALSEPPVSN